MSSSRIQAREAYDGQHVANDSPLGLVARIFQVALLDIRRAQLAIENQDFAAKGKAIGRLLRALALLQGSLDMERGEDVAANLDRLYNYFIVQVSRANVENSAAILAEIEPLLAELGEAWDQAAGRESESEPLASAAG